VRREGAARKPREEAGAGADPAARHCTPCRGGTAPLGAGEARALLERTPGWALEEGAARISRTFRFKDFAGAMALAEAVGRLAEEEGHHPDIRFGWGYCTVSFTTHKIGGLHENDFIMAAKVNALA
jgi:4a-hydroxytetrahydrobiopterin dehydratase